MLRLIIITVIGFFLFTAPSSAQELRGGIQKKLSDASNYFKQDNYFMGVSQINEACSLLKSNPQAMPETSFSAIAGKTVDDIDARIRDALSRHDVPTATRCAYAMQPLLNSMSNWEPQNPRWHYETGVMFRSLSTTLNDQFPVHLNSAIQELEKALAISGGGPYRARAQELLTTCQNVLHRRSGEISDFQRTHPLHNPNNQARPTTAETITCVFCGREHLKAFSCPYCSH